MSTRIRRKCTVNSSRMDGRHAQARANNNDLVLLNVGGQNFLVRRSILFRIPHSRLHMVACNDLSVATGVIANEPYCSLAAAKRRKNCKCDCHDADAETADLDDDKDKDKDKDEEQEGESCHLANTLLMPTEIIYFDRDPEIFRYILDYHRNGELHLPQSVCGPSTRKELIFWGVPETDIQACCLNHYAKYEEESSTKALLFKDFFEDLAPMKDLVKISRGWRQIRYKLWLFLDYPSSSWQAKAWASINLIFIILSVLVYSCRTHRWFRTLRPFAIEQNWTESYVDSVIEKLQKNISGKEPVHAEALKMDLRLNNLSNSQAADDDLTNPKVFRDIFTEPSEVLVTVDVVLTVYFLLEAGMKLIVAPDRIKYVKRFVVLVELISQVSFWIVFGMQIQMHLQANETTEFSWPQNVPNFIQSFRILRILKVAKLSDGLRVLILTLKRSITELALLAFLLVNGMFLFAWIVYLVEYKEPSTFQDVPNAFWWAIITLTGVGYGDVTPASGYGYLVGGFCAVSGCMVTGLAIPIIGHNFNTYYKYMKNQLREHKYLKDKGQDSDTQQGGLLARVKMLRNNNRSNASQVAARSNRAVHDDWSKHHQQGNHSSAQASQLAQNSHVDDASRLLLMQQPPLDALTAAAAADPVCEPDSLLFHYAKRAAEQQQQRNCNYGKRHESMPTIAFGDVFQGGSVQPKVRASVCA